MRQNREHRQLRDVAKRLGIRIRTGREFKVFFFTRTITVKKGAGPFVHTWATLHELGHAELIRRHEQCHLKTMVRLINMDEGYRPTEAFFRDYLNMEWKAWEQGMRIAKREGIRVNESQYWRHARKCHNSYVKHLRDQF